MAAENNPQTSLGTVLITGGCGFLGGHIVKLIHDYTAQTSASTQIHVLDLHTRNPHPQTTYHTGDLTSASSVRPILEKVRPDVVIHTASPVFSSGTQKSLEIMKKVNVDGTQVLVEECKRLGCVKAFVHTSSASVVSDTRQDLVNADERWLIIRGDMQREYYSDTKAEAEEWVLEQNAPPSKGGDEEGRLLTVALRPSGIFGEGDNQLCPGMIGAYHRGQTGWQFGDNQNLFDFTYVGNVAHAHILAAQRLLEAWDEYSSNPRPEGGDGADGEKAIKKVAVGGGVLPQEVEARVDGQAFFITNAAPVYFWDFARSLWFSYHNALATSASHPSKTSAPPALPGPQPVPVSKVKKMPFSLAITLATLAGWVFWLLRLGTPKLDTARVRYSCMTRYYKVAKAQALLGYTPVWEIWEGVDRTSAWWAERRREEVAEQEAKKGQ